MAFAKQTTIGQAQDKDTTRSGKGWEQALKLSPTDSLPLPVSIRPGHEKPLSLALLIFGSLSLNWYDGLHLDDLLLYAS